MKKLPFLKTSGSLVAMAAIGSRAEALAKTSPKLNLLLITVDDMNYSLPGFMGGKYNLTPELDKLAARSHRFVHNRTTAPICQPSREAMMTGRVPHRSGGLGFDPVNEGIPTLVTLLKEQGYFTAAIHKTEHMQPPSCFPWDHEVPGFGRRPSEYAEAVHEAMQLARAKGRPFFINCNINDPHRPFYGTRGATPVDHAETGEYRVARELHAEQVEPPAFLEDLPDVRKEFAQYCNSAQRMDTSIGKVLALLAASPEAAHTVTLFSSDHGMPFPFSKATVYDSGTRTPALLNYPGMGLPRAFNDRTCNIDYLPTLLDLMGMSVPTDLDGRSWVPLFHGHADRGREYLVTHVNGVASGAQYPMRAIQDDRFSLVFTPWSDGKLKLRGEPMSGLTFRAMKAAAAIDPRIAGRVEQYVSGVIFALYDFVNDPGQRTNLIHLPQHQERVERLTRLLSDYMERTGDPQFSNLQLALEGKQPSVMQPAKLRFDQDRMRLGYIALFVGSFIVIGGLSWLAFRKARRTPR